MTGKAREIQCWKCGVPLKNFEYPYSRYEECTACKADLHVCLLCRNYDPALSDACREDRADYILDKDKANFCDYFKPRPQAHIQQNDKAGREARAKLAELFGEETPDQDQAGADQGPANEADRALAELKRLFGDE